MKVYEVTSKVKENLLEDLLRKEKLEEKNIIFRIFESKTGLFKSTSYTIKAVKLEEVENFVKSFLDELLRKMGLNATLESQIINNQIQIKISSDKNSIVIGKGGQTLDALQNICRQAVSAQIQMLPYLMLDVEDYKTSRNTNIEKLALRVAKEVKESGIPAALDNMNSYERRLVHSILMDFDGVTTESEGQDPNRHVVIKKVN